MKQYTTSTLVPYSVGEEFFIFSSIVSKATLTNQLIMLFHLFGIIKSQNGLVWKRPPHSILLLWTRTRAGCSKPKRFCDSKEKAQPGKWLSLHISGRKKFISKLLPWARGWPSAFQSLFYPMTAAQADIGDSLSRAPFQRFAIISWKAALPALLFHRLQHTARW